MKQRYNLMLNPGIVSKIDKYAASNELSRSDVINQLLFEFVFDRAISDDPDPELEDQITMTEVIAE